MCFKEIPYVFEKKFGHKLHQAVLKQNANNENRIMKIKRKLYIIRKIRHHILKYLDDGLIKKPKHSALANNSDINKIIF